MKKPNKVYAVCCNNGYKYEDYEWHIVKVFYDEAKANKFKDNYKPEQDEYQDFEPKAWVTAYDIE